METQSEQQAEKPVVEEGATPAVEDEEEAAVDDTSPYTLRESVESVKQIGLTAKHGVLRPWYRFARRTVRNAQAATEAFFEGVMNEKGGKK